MQKRYKTLSNLSLPFGYGPTVFPQFLRRKHENRDNLGYLDYSYHNTRRLYLQLEPQNASILDRLDHENVFCHTQSFDSGSAIFRQFSLRKTIENEADFGYSDHDCHNICH